MAKEHTIGLFFRRTSKIFGVFIFVIVFFVFYNTYLVDQSLTNLKAALNKTAEAKTLDDFEKIMPLLKIPILKEVASEKTSLDAITNMELVENIVDDPKKIEQLEDVKFYLATIIKAKEKDRGPVMAALDKVSNLIFKPKVESSKKELESKEKRLRASLETIQEKGKLAEAYYQLGNLYIEMKDPASAEEVFRKISDIAPKNPLAAKAKFNLAWAYKAAGEYQKALAAFEALSEEYPEVEIATTSQFQVADTLYKKGDFQEARVKYAQLSKEHEDLEVGNVGLFQAGYISYYELDDKEGALQYFAELEKKSPQSELAKHTKTQTQEVVIKDYRREGFNLLKEKKYDQAMKSFNLALESSPDDVGALSGVALISYWKDDRETALEKTDELTRVSQKDEQAFVNSLFIYINTDRIDKAIEVSADMEAKGLKFARPEFYYNVGYAMVMKGNMEGAVAQFQRALSINPDFLFAYNNLGCCYWSLGRYSEAIKMFQEAVSLDRSYVHGHFNLGIVYFYQNQLEDSYEEFKKVAAIDPEYENVDTYLQRISESLKYRPK
ncbi:MAG: tetratricopeptide repeat protein [Candidatus Omnitrophica bacterium]|nr:tetratricopeptide repeat protein [Candidatus Omnitrophota bacterium]